MVTSGFRLEVEIFYACTMKNMQYNVLTDY